MSWGQLTSLNWKATAHRRKRQQHEWRPDAPAVNAIDVIILFNPYLSCLTILSNATTPHYPLFTYEQLKSMKSRKTSNAEGSLYLSVIPLTEQWHWTWWPPGFPSNLNHSVIFKREIVFFRFFWSDFSKEFAIMVSVWLGSGPLNSLHSCPKLIFSFILN